MKIEVVSSCWRYWRALCFHLSQYVLHPPARCHVTATVCYAFSDALTVRALGYFNEFGLCGALSGNVQFNFEPFAEADLMRRAIARNSIALECKADWIVFTDVDYLYPGQALDQMAAELEASGDSLCYTPCVLQSKTHYDGECELARVGNGPAVLDVDSSLYELKKLARPIGGSQIVRGATARRLGYVPEHPEFHRPCKVWQRTFEDVVFRKECGLPIRGLQTVGGVHRIRHSKRGRTDLLCEN